MDISFSNNTQVNELIGQLCLGQVIRVQVLEKTGQNHYLISYKNMRMTAVSEVDLLTKTVWLKLTQKTPFPKLQIIIEETDSGMTNFKGLFSDSKLTYLLNKGISIHQLMKFNGGFIFLQKQQADNLKKLNIQLLFTKDDIDKINSDNPCVQKLSELIEVVDNINKILSNQSIKLAVLYINIHLLTILLPVECLLNDDLIILTGTIKTKHFSNISFKYEVNKAKEKAEIVIIFECDLYLKALKKAITQHIKEEKINIILTVQNQQYIESKLFNQWSFTA